MEGFTRKDGYAFQCYGCKLTTTPQRTKNQRRKISQDVGKFIKNRQILAGVFGPVRITRWFLFVPDCDDKALVAHGNEKALEVIAANLPYVAPGFQVGVQKESQYGEARQRLLQSIEGSIKFECPTTSDAEVTQWAAQHNQKLQSVDGKLDKLPLLVMPDRRADFRDQMLRWYIEGQDLLECLRNYPDVYQQVIQIKRHRENCLKIEAPLHSGTASELFNLALTKLRDDYQATLKQLHRINVEALAYEAVGDWLLRCPLQFP